MIEVIYKEEKSGEETGFGFYLPKNIRQIGLIHENYRIYMEDYVYTFLGKIAALAMKKERQGRAAILTGENRWKNGVLYVFIKGALLMEETEIAADHIQFGEEAWELAEKEGEAYFPNQEVVGWFLTQAGMPVYATEILTRGHIRYFGGEKLLFLMEPTEKEDAFFRFENSFLVRQSGYYLYYEKNEAMQNYMLEKNELLNTGNTEQNPDEAVKNFRKMIAEKNEKKEESSPFLSYAATACLLLTVSAMGLRLYRSYQEIQNYNLVQETDALETAQNTVQPVFEEKTIGLQTITPVLKKEQPPKSTLSVTEKPERNISLKATLTPKLSLKKSSEPERETSMETSLDLKEEKRKNYIVRPGDSLFQISLEQYGTIEKVKEICEINNFSEEEMIYPGQIIVLP